MYKKKNIVPVFIIKLKNASNLTKFGRQAMTALDL